MKITKRVRINDLDTTHHQQVATAVQAARDWKTRMIGGDLDASLVLSGPYGTGKTHIAKSILWSTVYTVEGKPDVVVPVGRFFIANELLTRLAPSQDKITNALEMPRPSSLVGNAPMVIIDDVGGQQIIPYVSRDDQDGERHARYFRFIDYCYTAMVSVIITTNLSIEGLEDSQFARHIGGRAFDRLSEMAPVGFMVGLDGVPSWRQKQGGR